jgi:hypothetical protein
MTFRHESFDSRANLFKFYSVVFLTNEYYINIYERVSERVKLNNIYFNFIVNFYSHSLKYSTESNIIHVTLLYSLITYISYPSILSERERVKKLKQKLRQNRRSNMSENINAFYILDSFILSDDRGKQKLIYITQTKHIFYVAMLPQTL